MVNAPGMNRGGEYMSKGFDAFFAEKGIKHQCIVLDTPQQNSVVERKNLNSYGDGQMHAQMSEFAELFLVRGSDMCS